MKKHGEISEIDKRKLEIEYNNMVLELAVKKDKERFISDLIWSILVILFYGAISLILWIPLFALLLWGVTFIAASITFSWIFVFIISSFAAIISGIVAVYYF